MYFSLKIWVEDWAEYSVFLVTAAPDKWEHFFKISSLMHQLFLPREFRREENLLRRFIMGNVISFLVRKYSGHLRQFFNIINRSTFMYSAMRNPSRHSILGCILKPDKLNRERAFLDRQLVLFCTLVNGCSRGIKVFMIIEIFCKKRWKQKLGTEYRKFSLSWIFLRQSSVSFLPARTSKTIEDWMVRCAFFSFHIY